MKITNNNEQLVISLDKTEDKEFYERAQKIQPEEFFEYLFKMDKFFHGTDGDMVVLDDLEKDFIDSFDNSGLLTWAYYYLETAMKRIQNFVYIIPNDCCNVFRPEDEYNVVPDENIGHLCHELERLEVIINQLSRRNNIKNLLKALAGVDKTGKSIASIEKEIMDIIQELTDREARVMELHYGLIDNHPRTIEEISKEFGTTEEEIDAILQKAYKKMRHPNRRARLENALKEGE